MRSDLPDTHVSQSFELSADALVDLFKMELNSISGGTVLCMTAKTQVTWQGMVFESIPITLAGEGVRTDGQWNRPKLTIANPDGLFSAFIAQGKTDSATITRYRCHLEDVRNNVGRYQINIWRVSKTLSMSNSMATFELRTPLDGQMFYLPARAFYPPEFPHVSL
ncbi:phage minor tail protein L [Burkholderia pseudomallei]|uniref:hypothetical protein n=1 Tax=Burkholderia pseudomallei TaxID=28450 RepID=UPI000538A9C1|nr:hypothetical protein [Burkholderia pseudomallei]KGX19284.1 phage minor tail L family protein [Burkholderia pseudomallei ABCPW 1]